MSVMQNARFIGGPSLAVAAAGNSQATATALTGSLNVVTSATGTSADGVALPTGFAVGDLVFVVNATAAAVDVFPYASSGGTINGGSGDAAVTVPATSSAVFVSLGDDDWGAAYGPIA